LFCELWKQALSGHFIRFFKIHEFKRSGRNVSDNAADLVFDCENFFFTPFFLPHEINLIQLNAVSFTKGCYTGQEIIARMEYKGKLKKHLYTAEIQSYATPIPGVDVQYQSGHDILSAGTVVDACQTKLHHFQVLMLLHDEDVQGNDLFIDGDEDAFFQHIKLR